jgi:hypothetical protein
MHRESKLFKEGTNLEQKFNKSDKETRYSEINKCKEVYFIYNLGEENRIMNMEYLRNMIMGMKYQDGM